MNKLLNEIEEFEPINDQETKDKQLFLKYINTFNDVITRDNEIAHFTSSAFVVNHDLTKVLMVHHNIYNSWCWIGGHADGETDLLSVAKREVEEETGIKDLKLLQDEIYVIDTLPVLGHVRKGKYVSAHVHLSVAYLLMADEYEEVRIKEDENSDVKWINIKDCVNLSTEPHMKAVYEKVIDKINKQFK